MALYLNNLDLNGNQLQKAVVHPLGTAPSTAQEGQIYYDTGDNVIYVNTSTTVNSPTWVNMQSGDLTGITAGAGLTGTATSGDATLAVGSGNGITVNADDIAVTAAQTDITSIHNASLKIGRAAGGTEIDFSANANRIEFHVGSENIIKFKAGGEIEATKFDGALEGNADTATTAAGLSATLAVASGGTNATSFADKSVIISQDSGTDTLSSVAMSTNGQLLIGGTSGPAAATLTQGDNITITNADGGITIAGTADTNTNQLTTFAVRDSADADKTIAHGKFFKFVTATGALGTALTGTGTTSDPFLITLTSPNTQIANTTTGAQMTAATLKTKLNTAFGSNELTIGDGNLTTTIPGNVTITGTTTMSGGTIVNTTTNTAIKDTTIALNTGIGANANAADIGLILDRGTLGNAFMGWDESEDEFVLVKTSTEGSDDVDSAVSSAGVVIANDEAYLPLKLGSLELVNGGITLSGHLMDTIDITSEASDADDHLMSALAIKNRILDFGYTTNTGTTTAANTQTFTNKSIDANGTGNAITNIDIGNMTAAAVQLSSESFSDNDTSFMTSAAINDRFALINANTTGTAGNVTGVVASANLDADTAHLTTAQTFSGAKTFSSGVILDDGSGASPVLKFKNEADTHWTVQNDNSNNLKFTQATDLRVTFNAGGAVTIPGDIDLGGDIDVDGTMEADAITLAGASVHATDTNTSLGTSDTVVPSQKAVKAYVDAQGSSSSNTGGRQAFVLAAATSGVAATSTTVFTITHGMGASRNYGVEIIRNSANSGGGETVIVDVARPTDTTITVTFATAPTAGDYTALVCKY